MSISGARNIVFLDDCVRDVQTLIKEDIEKLVTDIVLNK